MNSSSSVKQPQTRMVSRVLAGTLAAVLFLTACETTRPTAATGVAQPAATQNYVHMQSRFLFPPTVGSFVREAVKQYDRNSNDISVGYNSLTQGVALTIYVYPIAQRPPDDTLDGHFGTCKAQVFGHHEGVRLVSEGASRISCGGQSHDGKHATFAYTELFAHQRQPVGSEVFLFTNERWFVMCRATYPVAQQQAAQSAIDDFLNKLCWP